MCERTQILGVDRDGGVRRLRRRPGVGDLAQRPRQAPAGDRDASRSRSGTPSSPPRRRTWPDGGRRPRLRAGRAVQHRDRARLRRREAARVRPRPVPHRPREEARRRRRRRRRRGRRRPGWFLEQNEGVRTSTSSSRCPGRSGAIEDAFGIVRHGGNVVLFGIPARPATIDIAESLIFKNLTVTAVNGRRDLGDLVHDPLAARARRRRPAAADHPRAAARALRRGLRAARDGRGLQDRPSRTG